MSTLQEQVTDLSYRTDRLEVVCERLLDSIDQTVREMKAEGARDRAEAARAREEDRAEAAKAREEDRAEAARAREEDRAEAARAREEDQAEAAKAREAVDRARAEDRAEAARAREAADRARAEDRAEAAEAREAADRARAEDRAEAAEAREAADRARAEDRAEAARAREEDRAEAARAREEDRAEAAKAREAADKERKEDRRAWNRRWGRLANKMGTVVQDSVAPSLQRIARDELNCGEEQSFSVSVSRYRSDDRHYRREFDALYVGARGVLLNETKSTAHSEYATRFVQFLKSGEFSLYFPEHRHLTLVPVFSSLRLPDHLIPFLTKNGIYAVTMGEETMQVLNRDAIAARERNQPATPAGRAK